MNSLFKKMSLFLLFSLCLFAEENKKPAQIKKFSNILGININSYTYEEPNVMKLNGISAGIDCIVSFNFDNSLFLRGDILLSGGKSKYTSNASGSMNNDPSYYLDTRIMLGVKTNLNKSTLAYYSGFGYRYLDNDSSSMQTTLNYVGYLRTNKLIYIPIGLIYDFNFNNGHSIETTVEYDCVIKGKQFSGLKGLPSVSSGSTYLRDSNVTQKKGFGIRFSSDYIIGNWSFGPYGRYWKIESSPIDSVPLLNGNSKDMYEPKNHTRELGLKISYRF